VSNPKLEVLTPQNSQLIFIDHQPQMAFGVQSIDRQTLKNSAVALAKAAKAFNIPTTITTVESQSFSAAKRFMARHSADIGIRETLDVAQAFVDTNKPRIPLQRWREHDGEPASTRH
jgi:nicotinamidase-related amidase